MKVGEVLSARMNAGTKRNETAFVHGHYEIECHDAEGNLLWSDSFDNMVVNAGLNYLIASGVVSGNAYMGLISASGYTGVALTDVIGTHGGWQEAGQGSYGPTYGTTRPLIAWGTISNEAVSNGSGCSYTMTGSGTIEGGFIVLGPSASPTVGNTTGGVLFSAGALTVPQPVVSGGRRG